MFNRKQIILLVIIAIALDVALMAKVCKADDYTATTFDYGTGTYKSTQVHGQPDGGFKATTFDYGTGSYKTTTAKPTGDGGYNATTFDYATGTYSTTKVTPR